MFTKESIIKELADIDTAHAERFAVYIDGLANEKSNGSYKNVYVRNFTEQQLAEKFRRVALDGLVFDGVHVTLQSTGISYDYVAYKKKMYLVYPETIFDAQIVYKGDTFSFKKENGKVIYSHGFANPFEKKEIDIMGAYAVVRNRRGEFIVTLTNEDIAKHKKVSKGDFIWKAWFSEMVMKTVAKKICKQFFADDFQGIEELDNENYDLENVVAEDFSYIEELKAIKTLNELVEYYNTHKGKGKEFDAALVERKNELIAEKKAKETLATNPTTDENP